MLAKEVSDLAGAAPVTCTSPTTARTLQPHLQQQRLQIPVVRSCWVHATHTEMSTQVDTAGLRADQAHVQW
jgi:hypothetical protein